MHRQVLFMVIKNAYPVSEKDTLFPKNIYGLSKKMNEEYVDMIHGSKTKYIGLRFFTVLENGVDLIC